MKQLLFFLSMTVLLAFSQVWADSLPGNAPNDYACSNSDQPDFASALQLVSFKAPMPEQHVYAWEEIKQVHKSQPVQGYQYSEKYRSQSKVFYPARGKIQTNSSKT